MGIVLRDDFTRFGLDMGTVPIGMIFGDTENPWPPGAPSAIKDLPGLYAEFDAEHWKLDEDFELYAG